METPSLPVRAKATTARAKGTLDISHVLAFLAGFMACFVLVMISSRPTGPNTLSPYQRFVLLGSPYPNAAEVWYTLDPEKGEVKVHAERTTVGKEARFSKIEVLDAKGARVRALPTFYMRESPVGIKKSPVLAFHIENPKGTEVDYIEAAPIQP